MTRRFQYLSNRCEERRKIDSCRHWFERVGTGVYDYLIVFFRSLAFVPMVLVAAIRERYSDWTVKRRGLKHPFTKRLRRPAGYSLAEEIRHLQMDAVARMFYALVFGTGIAVITSIIFNMFRAPHWLCVTVGGVGAIAWGA